MASPPPRLPEVVIDASVSMTWLFQDRPGCKAAEQLFLDGYKSRCILHAPVLWLWESANVLQTYARKGHIMAADIPDLLRTFRYPRIVLDQVPDMHIQQSTLDIAMTTGLSYYDASYVELARRLNAHLATFDQPMKAAAHQLGVTCLDL